MALKFINMLNHIVFNCVPFRCLVLAERGKMFEGICKHLKIGFEKTGSGKNMLATVLLCMMFCTCILFVRVDLFSLDIEGAEYDVLKTVPWDKVNIDALLIEVIFSPHCPEFFH
jgi:hypothetical protein